MVCLFHTVPLSKQANENEGREWNEDLHSHPNVTKPHSCSSKRHQKLLALPEFRYQPIRNEENKRRQETYSQVVIPEMW